MNQIKDKKGDSKTNTKEIQKIMKEHFENLYIQTNWKI
jgi:hypothetical protein